MRAQSVLLPALLAAPVVEGQGGFFFQSAPAPDFEMDDMETLLSMAAAASSVSPTGLVIVRRSTTYYGGGGLPSILGGGGGGPAFVVSRYDDDAGGDALGAGGDDGHNFECPCGGDVAAFCGEPAGDDDYQTIFEKRLCLAEHRGLLSPGCAEHLDSAPTVVEYCFEDIVAECRGVSPGENRVHACLREQPTLDGVCAAYVASVVPAKAPTPPGASSEALVDDAGDRTFESLVASSLDLLASLFDSPLFADDAYADDAAPPAPAAPKRVPDDHKKPFPSALALARGDRRPEEARAAAPVEEIVVEDEEAVVDVVEPRTTDVLGVVLLGSAAVVLLVALWVLTYVIHYTLRKRREREAIDEFKSKFAPLLAE